MADGPASGKSPDGPLVRRLVTRLWIAGGERAVAEAVLARAKEAAIDAGCVRDEEIPELGSHDALIDLGLPPAVVPAGNALVEAERARAASLGARAAGAARVVRCSMLGARADAPSAWQRAHAAAESEHRSRVPDAVALRTGILFGSCGLALALRRVTERFPIVAVPAIAGARFEPLALADFAAYCVEAAGSPAPLTDYYDLGCGEMLTGALFAQGLAESLGVRRWVVPLPNVFVGLVARSLSSTEWSAGALQHAFESVRVGRLLPRRLTAWDTFETRPVDLRSALASAAGMNFPLRRPGDGKRFRSWRAPEKKGLLGKSVPRRPRR